MNLSAVLVLVFTIACCVVHAQKTFSSDYLGSLQDFPTSFYAFPSTGGVETNVYYSFNETIKLCTLSSSKAASCFIVTGKEGVVGSKDGSDALLNSPMSIQSSDLFVDMGNHKIRKSGYNQASTFAGSGVKGFLDGPAGSAQFNNPIGICSYSNDYYVADAGNFRIRKISDGQVSTIAGTGEMGFSGDNGPAVNAKISYPYAITANADGVFFVDVANFRIRKIDYSSKVITTFAGNGVRGSTGDNGLATSASIDAYTSIVSHYSNSDLYFIDYTSSSIRAVLPNGKIYTVLSMPKLAHILMYNADTIYAITSDKNVYKLKTQNICPNSQSYIEGKCVTCKDSQCQSDSSIAKVQTFIVVIIMVVSLLLL